MTRPTIQKVKKEVVRNYLGKHGIGGVSATHDAIIIMANIAKMPEGLKGKIESEIAPYKLEIEIDPITPKRTCGGRKKNPLSWMPSPG